eukprot:14267110-Alexandrium_andersonii.AAC.1
MDNLAASIQATQQASLEGQIVTHLRRHPELMGPTLHALQSGLLSPKNQVIESGNLPESNSRMSHLA